MVRKPRISKKKSEGKAFKNRKKILFWIVGIISLILFLSVLSGHLPLLNIGSTKGKSFYVRGGETLPVLSPLLFVGRASEAYAVAKQYPNVMDQIFCYCKCDEPPAYHKSLLSCFTDKHGEG